MRSNQLHRPRGTVAMYIPRCYVESKTSRSSCHDSDLAIKSKDVIEVLELHVSDCGSHLWLDL